MRWHTLRQYRRAGSRLTGGDGSVYVIKRISNCPRCCPFAKSRSKIKVTKATERAETKGCDTVARLNINTSNCAVEEGEHRIIFNNISALVPPFVRNQQQFENFELKNA